MKDSGTRGGGGDGFWQYSWSECSNKEESSRMMNPDSSSSAFAAAAANASVHDDMTSWLHLDDPNYSSGNLNRASSSSVQVFRDTRLQQGFDPTPAADMHRQRSTRAADAALALAAGRAAGFFPQTGVEAFHRSRTVCQPLQLKSRSVSDTMAPSPQPSAFRMSPGKTPVHALDNRCESEGHPVTTRKSVDYWRTQATNSLDSDRSTLDSRSVQVQKQQQSNVGLAGAASSDKVYETSSMKQAETFTGSTGGSRSEQTEREYKRKEKDVEDTAGCHANDESADRRKPPRSKRSRAAEVHNLSERKRRDRINERMKALQELIPNSNKTDKASMLDEAIEYLKMLQHQLQMMSMRSGMMSPVTAIPHMPMPSPYGGINMGVRLVDVSGHQSLIPSHQGLSVNVAVPVSVATNGFLQGMNPDVYNPQAMNQQPQQQQQIHETYVQPHIHKQEDG